MRLRRLEPLRQVGVGRETALKALPCTGIGVHWHSQGPEAVVLSEVKSVRATLVASACRPPLAAPRQGLEAVRQHVAEFIEGRDGHICRAGDVFLTNGASSGIQLLLTALIAAPTFVPLPPSSPPQRSHSCCSQCSSRHPRWCLKCE